MTAGAWENSSSPPIHSRGSSGLDGGWLQEMCEVGETSLSSRRFNLSKCERILLISKKNCSKSISGMDSLARATTFFISDNEIVSGNRPTPFLRGVYSVINNCIQFFDESDVVIQYHTIIVKSFPLFKNPIGFSPRTPIQLKEECSFLSLVGVLNQVVLPLLDN